VPSMRALAPAAPGRQTGCRAAACDSGTWSCAGPEDRYERGAKRRRARSRENSAGARPHERPQQLVEQVGIQAGEDPSDGRLVRDDQAVDPQDPQRPDGLVRRPLADRHERPGTGDDRCQPDRQDSGQIVPAATATTRIRDVSQQDKQSRPGLVSGCGHSSRRARRCHRRVWSRSGWTESFRTSIQAPQTTPVPHATPVTPPQTCTSQPYPPTLPGPWVPGLEPAPGCA